ADLTTHADGGGGDMSAAGDGGGADMGVDVPRPELSCFCSTPGGGAHGAGRGGVLALLASLALAAVVLRRRVVARVVSGAALVGVLALGAHVAHAQHHAAPDAGVTAPPVDPSVAEARAHFQVGSDHYNHGRFSEAATEYEAAYSLSPRPALLHNIYLARRDMG